MRYWEALGKFSEITSYTKTKSSLYQPITRKTENGRTILADTNNSSNDFAVSAEIKPREYK
jgi:hypothetical protein